MVESNRLKSDNKPLSQLSACLGSLLLLYMAFPCQGITSQLEGLEKTNSRMEDDIILN